MPNRLSSAKSPYLRQHGDNPVDWYPWAEEAFVRARRENKPILLSVGYSACHWCHVMAHESFENPAIARLMNEHFINIKVDREEHPDVDQIYQQVTQLMTRSGGWPLTVFLTPELKPFFGGTYYPPEDRYGRPGFPRLLESLSRAYREQRDDVEENARRLLEAMHDEQPGAGAPAGQASALAELRTATERLLAIFDWESGGFGRAPKFPNVMALSLLWRAGHALQIKPARQAVILALVRMAEGGIYDQLGGGFHRYSVDDRWSVPHFEKMLYDNALLLRLYAEVLMGAESEPAPELAPDVRELFIHVLSETIEYVLRELTTAQGAFYSAQDADSEGEEGRYFVWTPEDLAKLLTPDEARVFMLRYGVTEAGNFEHGTTVLHLARSLSGIVEEAGASRAPLSIEQVSENLAFACAKLREARSRRFAPGLDDKILVAWNGLMISGLSWAARALEQAGRYRLSHRASIAAHRAFDWITTHGTGQESGSLRAVLSSDGEARIPGRLDDSAFMVRAALDLIRFMPAEAMESRLPVLRSRALLLSEHAWRVFSDAEGAGFYMTESGRADLVQRPASIHDQAIPAGSAVLLDSLLELREIGVPGVPYKWDSGSTIGLDARLAGLVPLVRSNPFGMAEAASALLRQALGTIVIKGDGSLKLQGHFAVTQAAPPAAVPALQLCHRNSCLQPSLPEARALLRSKLVPGLQNPSA
jgi:uncharacterized protein YyaL (SSP411 family)